MSTLEDWLARGAFLAFSLAALGTGGCESNGRSEGQTAPAPSTITSTVNEPGLQYFYRAPARTVHSTTTLADIPDVRRAAVMFYDPSAMPAKAVGHGVYVADLRRKKAGEGFTARFQTRRAFYLKSEAIDRGLSRARTVVTFAREWAKLHPKSRRTAESRRARRLLDDIVSRETDAGAPQDSHASPPNTRDTR